MMGNRTDQIWAHKGKETQVEEDKVWQCPRNISYYYQCQKQYYTAYYLCGNCGIFFLKSKGFYSHFFHHCSVKVLISLKNKRNLTDLFSRTRNLDGALWRAPKKARKQERKKKKERTHFSYVTAMNHLLLAVSFRLFRGWDFWTKIGSAQGINN